MSPTEKLGKYLASRGKRLTREKGTLVEEVFATREQFDSDQIATRLADRTDGTRVSRATVYRVLLELVEAGLIRRVDRAEGRQILKHVD